MNLTRLFLRMCRRCRSRPKVADSSGLHLSGGQLLVGTLAVRQILRRKVLEPDERFVGILLPPSVGSVLANMALTVDRRVTANLNYTLSSDVLNTCLAQCGIRHVLTSRRVLERFPLRLSAEVVFVEDLREQLSWRDKLLAAAQGLLLPVALLERLLGLCAVLPDDLLTVMFTSGSTGEPKGVMLSYGNIGANVVSINDLIRFSDHDSVLGVLPMFHSFGYTTTLWTAMTLAPRAVYHYTPLEARQIGRLCREHGCTFLVATPTFLRNYLRRCEPEELRTLEVVFAGAEHLPGDLIEAFHARFGVRPIEGYGTTELSPVVAGNVPPGREVPGSPCGTRDGTVGRPILNVKVKVVDLVSGEDLPCGRAGMLLVKGDNVMQGYLGRPDLTAEVMRDGWYVTGDVAEIDADGFIRITGRISRFSKIGGEMIPHIRLEEAINEIIGHDEQGDVRQVVTAVADDAHGERIVVLYKDLPMEPAEICRRLIAAGLPPLWVPSPASFRRVDAIPVLATGKLDLDGIKRRAAREFATLQARRASEESG